MNLDLREKEARIPQNEQALIERAQNGDRAAMEALLVSCEKRVYNIAYRYMGNEADAYDMAQETLIKVYKALSSFRNESTFSSWVYRLCVNTCLDGLRKRKKAPVLVETAMDFMTQDTQPSPEDYALFLENSGYLQKTIDMLGDDHKSVIILRDINGLSYEEVAQSLGITIGTVKSRLSRARQRLREMLGCFEQSC